MIIINILIPVAVLGGIGLFLGLMLGIASKYLAVKKDPRFDEVLNALPGANCGACGFAGCASYADNIVSGSASVNKCPVGGEKVANEIAEIMGVTAESAEKYVAKVLCRGTEGVAKNKYIYEGNPDCYSAKHIAGGQKECPNGCLGFGSCQKVCQFDAIDIVDGVAVVNPEKCTACGACVSFCPKSIIKLIPAKNEYFVGCSNNDKGVVVKDMCTAGCIACRLCEKACEYGAIKVENNLAVIDYEKCTNCGACAEKCPKKIIVKTK